MKKPTGGLNSQPTDPAILDADRTRLAAACARLAGLIKSTGDATLIKEMNLVIDWLDATLGTSPK